MMLYTIIDVCYIIHVYLHLYTYIYIYRERERDTYVCAHQLDVHREGPRGDETVAETVRPVHLLRVFLLRVLESNFPGDPL